MEDFMYIIVSLALAALALHVTLRCRKFYEDLRKAENEIYPLRDERVIEARRKLAFDWGWLTIVCWAIVLGFAHYTAGLYGLLPPWLQR